MQVDVPVTLIEQFRETFEGEVHKGWCWITDGKPESAVFGTIASLTPEQAFAVPVPGAKSIAAHVEHLRFTLDLTLERLRGGNPEPDWASSFRVPATSQEAWAELQSELRRAYDAVLKTFEEEKPFPIEQWVPIHVAGLAAMTAHNAYHLGAIRQIAQVVRSQSS